MKRLVWLSAEGAPRFCRPFGPLVYQDTMFPGLTGRGLLTTGSSNLGLDALTYKPALTMFAYFR